MAELELSPLYPCDTWPAEWLHTAQCTHLKHYTVHSVHGRVQVHTSANIKGISSFEAEELRTQILCMSSQRDCGRQKQNLTPSSSFPFKELPDQTEKYAKWKICKIRNNKIEVIQIDAKGKMQGKNSPHLHIAHSTFSSLFLSGRMHRSFHSSSMYKSLWVDLPPLVR